MFYCVSGCHNLRIKHNKQFQLACFYLLLPDICGIFNKDMKYHIFGLRQKDARLWLLVDAIWSQDWAFDLKSGLLCICKTNSDCKYQSVSGTRYKQDHVDLNAFVLNYLK